MFKKSFTIILISSLLLLGCDFRPSHKVIEYDEEVKLSNGEMIWVHIKRHYRLAGEPFKKANYLPSIVEISWDTGFPNVGRQSVFFDESLDFIDKIGEVWYVVGKKYPYAGSLKGIKSPNCQDVGVAVNASYNCVFRINNQGEIIKTPIKAKKMADIQMNFLYTIGIKDWGILPKDLDKTQLFWLDKLELQKTQSDERQLIGRPYSYDFLKQSIGGEL